MNVKNTDSADYEIVTPDFVIQCVEDALGEPCTNLCRPMNSYINRVYELQMASGTPVIVKFYRPGRWSKDALLDEQEFLFDLQEAEVPVIAPMGTDFTASLHESDNLNFALFPKKGGRIVDEPNEGQWKELGRLVGRMHIVGSSGKVRDRISMHPGHSTMDHVDAILSSDHLSDEWAGGYEDAATQIIDQISPSFDDVEFFRIHGDLHAQNIIYRPGESFYLIDFDDMALGPAVQDIWMLLPGRVQDARRELNLFLEGYELFREFDDRELKLVEPLRAMRFIHYTAWCVHQADEYGFQRLHPDFGTPAYWRQEIEELERQLQEIEDA